MQASSPRRCQEFERKILVLTVESSEWYHKGGKSQKTSVTIACMKGGYDTGRGGLISALDTLLFTFS